ncbi:unnamed protein product [Nezara viridula]|uniref:Neuropeptide n=1 Tax=Nezara viridula TaxID=85310 RepID=A0A9P0HLC0_NEZVI|nr:unnamed protein product [Nezara viridula]
MINMIELMLKFTVFILFLIEFTSGTELIEVEIDDDPPPNWPEDLSTSSQIVFRPLFVYKQKKAAQVENNRRKAELAIEVLKKDREPIGVSYRPHYYYNPYPSYYYNHNYRPYYYNYYPYYPSN